MNKTNTIKTITTALLIIGALCAPGTVFAQEAPLDVTKAMVSFTFDDGFASTYNTALPILNANDYAATMYIATNYVSSNKAEYMTWAQVESLYNDYHWDIGSHTINHKELEKLNATRIERQLSGSKQLFVSHGIDAKHFATPFGSYNPTVLEYISKYYESHRGFWDRGQNVYPFQPYLLRVQSVERDVTIETIESWIDQAKADNTWLILVYHDIQDAQVADDEYITTVTKFQQVVDYVKQSGIQVATVDQALQKPEVSTIIEQPFATADLGTWTIAEIGNWTIQTPTIPYLYNQGLALKVTPLANSNTHVYSPKVEVKTQESYWVEGYLDAAGLTSGEVGFYIDEYNEWGQWISGQWLGAAYPGQVQLKSNVYTPTSADVRSIRFQIYVNPSTNSTVWIDELQFSRIGAQGTGNTETNLLDGVSWHNLELNTVVDSVFAQNTTQALHFVTDQMQRTAASYVWNQYIQANFTGGEIGWYIDEYDANGNWISGQWKGKISEGFNGWVALDYIPTSADVAAIRLQYYIDAQTAVTTFSASDLQLTPAL